MQYLQVTCPNCKSNQITKTKSGRFLCSYCRTEFTADFDEVDAAMYHDDTNVQMQENQYQHEKDMKNLEFEQEMKRKSLEFKANIIAPLVSLGIILVFVFAGIRFVKTNIKKHQERVAYDNEVSALRLEVNSRGYLTDFEQITDDEYDYIINNAKWVAQTNMSGVFNGDWRSINDPQYIGSYLFVKYNKEYPSTALAVIFEETWRSDKLNESINKYVTVVYEDIKLNDDGSLNTVISGRQKQWKSNLGENGGMIVGLDSAQAVYDKLVSDYYNYNVYVHQDKTLNDL